MTKPEPRHETPGWLRTILKYVIWFIGIVVTLLTFGLWGAKRKSRKSAKPVATPEPQYEIRSTVAREVPSAPGAEAKSKPQHEPRGAWPSVPTYAILFMAVFVTGSAFGVWGLVHLQWPAPPPFPNPFANEPQPPSSAPHLQVNPAADLARLNHRMEKRLHSVGWINRQAGIVHIPIDRAMDLLIKRGASPITALHMRDLHEQRARFAQNGD